MSEIGIGTRLWMSDPYAPKSGPEPWWVVGQTATSWIVSRFMGDNGAADFTVRVSKTDLRTRRTERRMVSARWQTDEQRRHREWMRDNHRRIFHATQDCSDAAVLRQIATLLNVEARESDL